MSQAQAYLRTERASVNAEHSEYTATSRARYVAMRCLLGTSLWSVRVAQQWTAHNSQIHNRNNATRKYREPPVCEAYT